MFQIPCMLVTQAGVAPVHCIAARLRCHTSEIKNSGLLPLILGNKEVWDSYTFLDIEEMKLICPSTAISELGVPYEC